MMQNFLTVKQLAKILNVDPSSLNKWELMKVKPLPEFKNRIMAWIKQNKTIHN
jgi:transcriptional regulator with XRE-family HTH domain